MLKIFDLTFLKDFLMMEIETNKKINFIPFRNNFNLIYCLIKNIVSKVGENPSLDAFIIFR
jgi:hypothetical protein